MSRSLRAYSERSSADDGVGTRRRFRASSSMARTVTNGLLSFRLEDSIAAIRFMSVGNLMITSIMTNHIRGGGGCR